MIRYVAIASWFVILYFLVESRFEIKRLNEELILKNRPIPEVTEIPHKKFRSAQKSTFRTQLFAQLHEINRNGKKVTYRPSELIIEDLQLSKDDRFLDLLDMLYEHERLQGIEIPKNEELANDLKLAGFGSDYIKRSKDSIWRIRFKE